MTTTVADAVTTLRERLDETTAAQWTDIQLRRWLNEGIRDIARRTRQYMDTDTIAVSADDAEYTVSTDVLHIMAVYFTPTGDTRMIRLEARSWEGMDNIWADQQNIASQYPALFTTYGYSPTLTIKLFPVPSVAGDLTLHIARLPAALDVAAGTGNIDVIEGWLEVVYDFAEYMALRKDRDERWQESMGLYESKLASLIEMGDFLNAPGEFSYAGSGMLPNWLIGDY